MLRQSKLDVYRAGLRSTLDLRRHRHRSPTDPGDTFRVGIVGLGRVARRHVWGYQQTGRALLVAAADPEERQRRRAAEEYGFAQVYEHWEGLFAEAALDLVSICTPAGHHAGAVRAAAAAGVRGILCEKPLCTSLSEADELIGACREAGVLLTIGHQRRFSPQHELAHRIVKDGMLGPVHAFSGEWPRDTLRSGIHVADSMRFYVGEVASVVAQLERAHGVPIDGNLETSLERGRSDDRRGAILVRFRDCPTIGFFRVEDRPLIETCCHFLAERGELEVCCNGGVRFRTAEATAWEEPELEQRPQWLEFRLEIESLMAAVRGEAELELTGEDGRRSLEITEAILRSAIEGREVSLPLDTGGDGRPR